MALTLYVLSTPPIGRKANLVDPDKAAQLATEFSERRALTEAQKEQVEYLTMLMNEGTPSAQQALNHILAKLARLEEKAPKL